MEGSVPLLQSRSSSSPSNKNETSDSSFFEVSTPSLFLRIKENSSTLSTHALHVAEHIIDMNTRNSSISSSQMMRDKNFQCPGKKSLKLGKGKEKLVLPSSESYYSRTGKIINDLTHPINVVADHSHVASKGSNKSRDTLFNAKSGTAKIIVSNQPKKEKNCANSKREIIITNAEDTGNKAKLKRGGDILMSHDSHKETSVVDRGNQNSNSNAVGNYCLETNCKLQSTDEVKYHKALTEINYVSDQSLSQQPQMNLQTYNDGNKISQLTNKISSNASSTSNSSTDERDCDSKVTLSESEYSPTYLPVILPKSSSKLQKSLSRQAQIQRSNRNSNNLIEQKCNIFDDNEIVFDSEVYTESDNNNSGPSIKSNSSVCGSTRAYRTRLRLKRRERRTRNRNEIVTLISSKESSPDCSENGNHNTKSESESDFSVNTTRKSSRRRPLRKRRKVLGTERRTRDRNEIVTLISSKESSPDYSEKGNHNTISESESDFSVNTTRKSSRRRPLRKRRKVLGTERRTRDRNEIVTLISSKESSPDYSEKGNHNTISESESDFSVDITRKSSRRRPLRKRRKVLGTEKRTRDRYEFVTLISSKESSPGYSEKGNHSTISESESDFSVNIGRKSSRRRSLRKRRKVLNSSSRVSFSNSDGDTSEAGNISTDNDETENYRKPINMKEMRIVLEDKLRTASDFKTNLIKPDINRMESEQSVRRNKRKQINKSKYIITVSSDSDHGKQLETIQKPLTIPADCDKTINLKEVRIVLEDKLKTAVDFKTNLIKPDLSRMESDQPVRNTKSKTFNKSKHLRTRSSNSDPSKQSETIQKSLITSTESDEAITGNYTQPINLKEVRIILEDKLKTACDFKTTLIKRDNSKMGYFLNFNENVRYKYEAYTEKIISQNEIEIIILEEKTSHKSDSLCDSNKDQLCSRVIGYI